MEVPEVIVRTFLNEARRASRGDTPMLRKTSVKAEVFCYVFSINVRIRSARPRDSSRNQKGNILSGAEYISSRIAEGEQRHAGKAENRRDSCRIGDRSGV